MVIQRRKQNLRTVRHVVPRQSIITLPHLLVRTHGPGCQGQGGIGHPGRNRDRHLNGRDRNFPNDVDRLLVGARLGDRLEVQILGLGKIKILLIDLLLLIFLYQGLSNRWSVTADQIVFNLLVKN